MFLRDLVKMLRNVKCSVGKNHENTIENTINSMGITNNRKRSIHYIKHPNGSQMTPDFKIVHFDKFINIECKSSSKGYIPMWNSVYPKKDTLYVFSNTRDSRTIVFDGGGLLSKDTISMFDEYHKKAKMLEKEYNTKLDLLADNKYNFRVYARKMYIQGRKLETEDLTLCSKLQHETLTKNTGKLA